MWCGRLVLAGGKRLELWEVGFIGEIKVRYGFV